MSKNYIRIQSKIDVAVSAGLQSINMSNKDAHVPDRLNVKAAWVGTRTLVHKGVGVYPIELKNWDAVKSLVKNGILTLGDEYEEVPTDIVDCVTTKEETEEARKTLLNEIARYKKMKADAEADPQATEVKKAQTLAY